MYSTQNLVSFQNNGGRQDSQESVVSAIILNFLLSFKVYNQLHYNVKSQSKTVIKAALKHC